ncbi:GTP-binding protein Era-like-protein [Gemmatirosa kalamazoonensis]|uniref:GTPase Era n=1 Tax=Gemmatirosa kalamazoonensis TaxID=861299 RepID=W0RJZ0_9BACT|nr:GTPase Era [Gemmatirosa kalamazoonensis]AHG90742.1 GTP-binding protein Era-like-protein [Gemmatirosa kalamazoonensis]
MTRAGIVTVVGKPNAGKSTLLNRIVGEKLSITSPKPQSTRDRIVGIRTADDAQMVLLDTPGLLEPRYALQEAMRGIALEALRDADVVAYLVDATDGDPPPLMDAARLDAPPRAPTVLVLNKIDALDTAALDGLRARHPDAAFVSATRGDGVDELLVKLRAYLPESPFLYPEDEISTQTLRFFASELVRETALEQLEEEVPYSVACEVEEFREDRSPVYIRAVLYVERESQKRILIGAKGARIREIGRVARGKIEALIGAPAYLDLWIKVLSNWRRDPRSLRRFGFVIPKESGQ